MNKRLYSAAKNVLLCCALFFLFLSRSHSQDTIPALIGGQVVDAESRQPIPGLPVLNTSGEVVAVTDSDGFFEFYGNPNDSIEFRGMGYLVREEAYAMGSTSVIYGLRQSGFEMTGVLVNGYQNGLQNAATPGSFGIVRGEDLRGGDQSSIMNGVNMIPGVVMESRGYGGSHRINIRGSFLRSPFAVRNVKTYLNEIPLSSPDGSSPLELIDVFDIGRLEVVKGPAGSMWGSGTGGVLLLSPRKPDYGVSVQSQVLAGAWGMFRSAGSVAVHAPRGYLRASHVYQGTDGYRAQEFNRKQQVSVFGEYRLRKMTWFLYTTSYNGHWGLPGALSREEVEEDPRQARPFSQENNASLYRNRWFAGASQKWQISDHWSHRVSLYATSTQKYNPYGTSAFSQGFKDEAATGIGGRTSISGLLFRDAYMQVKMHAGGEWQSEHFTIEESDNNGGLPGDFYYAYDVDYLSLMGFAGLDVEVGKRLFITASASANSNTNRAEGNVRDGFAFDTLAALKTELLPRLAASWRLATSTWIHAGVSYGNSNPTVFEQFDYENDRLNVGLSPEHGVNYEFGLKGEEGRSGIQFDITAYWFRLEDAIIAQAVSSGDDMITIYANAGSTEQRGVEASVRRAFVLDEGRHRIELWCSYTGQFYTFDQYLDANGKRLPGTPQSMVNAGFAWLGWEERLQWRVYHFYTDRMPLNNNNDVWSSAFHIINTRADVRVARLMKDHLAFVVYAGLNNATDTEYTSFHQLNGTSGRYFNPSAPLNMFAGLTISGQF